jgi:hypothetical protein
MITHTKKKITFHFFYYQLKFANNKNIINLIDLLFLPDKMIQEMMMKKIIIPFKKFRIELYNKPGKWMDNKSLFSLQNRLGEIAEKRLSKRPEFSFFGDVKHLQNKLVVICSDRCEGIDKACCILSYLGRYRNRNAVHLGAVYSTLEDKGLMRMLYGFAGFYLLIQNLFVKKIYITSLTHTPRIFGVVDEILDDSYPNLNPDAAPSSVHLMLKDIFIETYLKEWSLDSIPVIGDNFVIRGFRHQKDGSILYPDSELNVPKHRKACYNARCLSLINIEEGDVIFQAGYTNGLWSFIKRYFKLTPAVKSG